MILIFRNIAGPRSSCVHHEPDLPSHPVRMFHSDPQGYDADFTFSWRTRLRFIYQATMQHALNLAKFVTIYKTMLLVQKQLTNGGKERTGDSFWAGLVGGWMVFGDRSAVNEQVNLIFPYSFYPTKQVPGRSYSMLWGEWSPLSCQGHN